MRAPHAAHQHHPTRVVHDLELDEQGRPAKWLWHLECRTCGQPLDHDLTTDADQAAVALALAVAS
jgi:hypothetical protein